MGCFFSDFIFDIQSTFIEGDDDATISVQFRYKPRIGEGCDLIFWRSGWCALIYASQQGVDSIIDFQLGCVDI